MHMVILALVNLALSGDRLRLTDGIVQPIRYFMNLLPPNQIWRITMAQNMAVTTCRLPLQTAGYHNNQQVESSIDTTSTLSSTNSRAV